MFRCYRRLFWTIVLFPFVGMGISTASQADTSERHVAAVQSCLQAGWKPLNVKVTGRTRAVLWKRPRSKWKAGTIVILHGDGGSHHQFCAGGKNLEPQIEFAEDAIAAGFAVFLLDSTDEVVDAQGKQCGKNFDFSVLARRNLDLHFIGKMVKTIIPQLRPVRSSKKIFLTGVATGGYMAIRAATHFNSKITAFAPVAAGDPYGTRMLCDVGKPARMLLIDLTTNKQVGIKKACVARRYRNVKDWPHIRSKAKPAFKMFHNKGDAVVDISCMYKVKKLLQQHGYSSKGAVVLDLVRDPRNHLWHEDYNEGILDFFKNQ